MELFNNLTVIEKDDNEAPLAYRLAPAVLEEYFGQEHLLGEGKPIRQMLMSDKMFSLILWGPPGCGKTALSKLIARHISAQFYALNAVTAKIQDIKVVLNKAEIHRQNGKKTMLLIDEIHRFNKAQQDALLPDVEKGLITMVGITTQNPYFSVIPALLSRTTIFELYALNNRDLKKILIKALKKEGISQEFSPEVLDFLIQQAKGDARKLLNSVEMIKCFLKEDIEMKICDLENMLQSKGLGYGVDDHYDLISAYIKSMRGSDVDAAVYWLARMLKGGEDPLFIARRMVIFASEDIGNADPQALLMAQACFEAARNIGMPEVQINLAHGTTYLAKAPKSNASYQAILAANRLIDEGIVYKVPKVLKDSHYHGAKKMGFGQGYKNPHFSTEKIRYLPTDNVHKFYNEHI
jgi:putative ATPase